MHKIPHCSFLSFLTVLAKSLRPPLIYLQCASFRSCVACCLSQVAKDMIKGIKRGDYMLPNPDLTLSLLQAGAATTGRRSWAASLLECLLGPIKGLVFKIVGMEQDGIAARAAKTRFKDLLD